MFIPLCTLLFILAVFGRLNYRIKVRRRIGGAGGDVRWMSHGCAVDVRWMYDHWGWWGVYGVAHRSRGRLSLWAMPWNDVTTTAPEELTGKRDIFFFV